MALDTGTATTHGAHGEAPQRPSFITKFTIDGDAAYTALAGSEIEEVLQAVLGGCQVTVTDVIGYAVTKAAPTVVTGLIRYDPATKSIFVNTIAAGAALADGDYSTSLWHLTALSQ